MQESSLAKAIDAIVFYALLAVIAFAAIPYGTVQPWWKSLFQCVVFGLAALSIVGRLGQRKSPRAQSPFSLQLLWPVLALIALALLQTLPAPRFLLAASDERSTVSADVFQTREFIVQIFALLAVAWLLITHTNSRRRMRRLVELVIAVGVVSALFGLWRQASQHANGFGLRGLRAGYGYAQFINANHFAFLMELVLGLALGIVVCRGVRGRRFQVYLVAAIPMWLALVLANSRGGILSLLCQVVLLALLFSAGLDSREVETGSGKVSVRLLRASRSVGARVVLVVALLFGAITTVVLVGGDPLAGRVDSLALELDRNVADTFTLRPTIWRATWELIKEHPVAGVGFGGYWIAITKYHAASGEATPQQAHNDYLELLASGGVIGLAIGGWFAFALVRTAQKKLAQLRTDDRGNSFTRAVKIGALVGILTVAVHSLVDFGLHITINAVVFTSLVAVVCMSIEKREIERKF
jgi:O-antigen ligase